MIGWNVADLEMGFNSERRSYTVSGEDGREEKADGRGWLLALTKEAMRRTAHTVDPLEPDRLVQKNKEGESLTTSHLSRGIVLSGEDAGKMIITGENEDH